MSRITCADVNDDLSNATVRPEFTGTLAIKAGRHPILGIIKTAGALVPNDTYCCDSSSFQLIRGPKLSAVLVSHNFSVYSHLLPDALIGGVACQVRNLLILLLPGAR